MPELYKLGKRPAHIDSRTLKLSNYLQTLAPPPPSQDWTAAVKKDYFEWGMMLNDSLGCCTMAAAGHMEMEWSANAGKPIIMPTDAQIETGYSAVGGYVPGDPSTDNG